MKTRMRFTKTVSWSLALLMAIFAVGCDGDHGTATTNNNPPTVTSTIPANGDTGVQINRIITATFSMPMDATTITTATFKVTGPGPVFAPVVGTVTYVGQIATFTPTNPLAASTLYTATITTGARSSVGVAKVADYNWTFTTGLTADTTSPTLILTGAADGEMGLPVNRNATATFSEPMDPATLASPATSFTVCSTGAIQGGPCLISVAGVVTYLGNTATFNPNVNLAPNTWYTSEIAVGATDLAGNPLVAGLRPNPWDWQTGALADVTAPTITLTNPVALAIDVPVNQKINATFSEDMDPSTMLTVNYSLKETVSNNNVTGTVAYDVANRIATFSPSVNLTDDTDYTATVTNGVTDLAGNPLVAGLVANPWTFRTPALPILLPVVDLGTIAPFGTFGGSAGMTNTGIQTVINGDIGTIATGTGSITGFHDTAGDVYTEVLGANEGAVNGLIYTCTNSTTGPTSGGPNAAACAIATQSRLDAEAAYLALAAMPVVGASPAPGDNLAGLTLLPGVYVSTAAGFMIQGGDLTLDAQGDANASWVFQMPSTTLLVGGPGATAPQSVILANGALAKNVFWQVGTAATINAAGGGTMEGTIISSAGAAFSTVGNTTITTLNGRVISLGASVTLVDTVINVPAP